MPKNSILSALQIAVITQIGVLLSATKKTELALAAAHEKQAARLNRADNNHTMQVIGGQALSTDPEINVGIKEIRELDLAHSAAVKELDGALSKIIEDKEAFFIPLLASVEEGTSDYRMLEAAQGACLDRDMHPMNRAKKLLAAIAPFMDKSSKAPVAATA